MRIKALAAKCAPIFELFHSLGRLGVNYKAFGVNWCKNRRPVYLQTVISGRSFTIWLIYCR